MKKLSKVYSALALSIFNLIPHIKLERGKEIGLSDMVLDSLSRLNAEGQHYLAERASRFLFIHFDEHILSSLLDNVEHERQVRELEDEFIRAKASGKMMSKFFGMHSEEFCARRRLFGMEGEGQHRPKDCDESMEILIWQRWQNNAHLDERQRYLVVGKQTGQPLRAVRRTIERHTK